MSNVNASKYPPKKKLWVATCRLVRKNQFENLRWPTFRAAPEFTEARLKLAGAGDVETSWLNSFVFRVADLFEVAFQAFRFARLAHFASMPNQLVRKQNPFFLRNHLYQILLHLLRIGIFRQIKSPRYPQHVRI